MGKLQTFTDRIRNRDIEPMSTLSDRELAGAARILARRYKGEECGSALLLATGLTVALVENVQHNAEINVSSVLGMGAMVVGFLCGASTSLETGLPSKFYQEELAKREQQALLEAQQARLARESQERAEAIIAQIPSIGIG